MTPARVALLGGSALALVALNLTGGVSAVGGYRSADITALPGWSFTRASAGYAERLDGTLVAFASGAPRITDKGLLIEEARTNLLLRSQEFGNGWTLSNATVTSDAIAAPDGTLTADKLVEGNVGSVTHGIYRAATIVAGQTYSIPLYFKAGGRSQFLLWGEGDASNGPGVAVDLAAGTITATGTAPGAAGGAYASSSIQALANGWFRVNLTGTAKSDQTTVYCHITLLNGPASTVSAPSQMTYTGDGASGIYLWGAQLEVGAFPTSYIATTGAAATRAADVPLVSGLAVPPTHSGVVRFRWTSRGSTGFPQGIQLDDGTNDNRVAIYRNDSSGTGTLLIVVAGVTVAAINLGALALDVEHTIAWRCKAGAYAVSVNGGAVASNAAATATPLFSYLRPGQSAGSPTINAGNGVLARCALYSDDAADSTLRARSAA